MKLFSAAQAAIYINDQLPPGEKWTDPINTLQYHRLNGNIHPVPIEGEEHKQRRTILYTQAELDRFLGERRVPGNQPIDLSQFEDQMGQVPDTVIARQAGCSSRTVMRWRQKKNIPAWRSD